MFKKLPKWIKLTLLFSLLITLSLLLVNLSQKNPSPYQFFTGSQNVQRLPQLQPNTTIESIFENEIPKLGGNWAVVVKDLKTGKNYHYNQKQIIAAASIYKLTTMWAVFDAIENGQITLDDPVGNTTVEEALRLMITISDNDAAIALSEKIGWGKIHHLMESEGIVGFDLIRENGPYTTAKATADLLERIYKNTAVSPSASKKMLELLLAQKISDRIPKYLPASVKVAHKTGEIDDFRHDVGIVMGQKGHYIFVFLTQTQEPVEAFETIAQLSKKIYDALETP